MGTTTLPTTESIKSEFREFPSRNGLKTAAFIDHPPEQHRSRRFVIMVPKYAETKKNNLQMAYHLAANGLTVLRFDFTCHFGESEGNMLDFTLPESVENIVSALDFLEREYGARDATLIASSLSALPAFRAAAEDRRVSHMIGVVPVVDFAYTIDKIYQEDLIGGYLEGQRYGVLDIMGHDVNMDNFCPVLIDANMHNLEGTVETVKRIECPVTLFPAARDVWIAMEDINTVAAANANVRVRPIKDAMHEVRENRAAADGMLRDVVIRCWERAFEAKFDPAEFALPENKLLFSQNRIERDRLRKACPVSGKEDEFWGEYLGKYGVMEKMADYQEYLDLVGSGLGSFRDGEIVLDAGCGNGLFGVWVLRAVMERSKKEHLVPPLYLGIDLTDEGLQDAVEKHDEAAKLLQENKTSAKAKAKSAGLLYSRADLDYLGVKGDTPEETLRFKADCFDKIVCSLVLSYLQDPRRLVYHFYRILRPGGKIVITSMKPFCDLSAIYRDFVEQKAARRDVESARELLRAAGAIQVKQDQGYYVFFSDEELTGMLAEAGFEDIQCFSSLGNQANVAVASK